jgi:hypothetical protein
METLEKILTKLNLSHDFTGLVSNEIKIPIVGSYDLVTKYWYPHPPCLLPLFIGYGASYQGILHHFFCERKNTFIEYSLENGYFSEIARNEKQFMTLMILKMIMAADKLSDEILAFCKNIHFDDAEKIDDFAVEYGDNPDDFNKLIWLKDLIPFKNVKNIGDYDGDFPSSIYIINPKTVNDSCFFEISDNSYLEGIKNIPNWLYSNTDKKELFYSYIENNDLRGAWFSLNSKGWLLKDVAEALNILCTKSKDELLNLITEYWLEGWNSSKQGKSDSY